MSGLFSHRMLVVVLIGVLAAAGDAWAQTTWYVDDDAPGDPAAAPMGRRHRAGWTEGVR